MRFWRIMTWAWGLMAAGLAYEYAVEGGSTRLFVEFAFLLLQSLLAHTASKEIESEGE